MTRAALIVLLGIFACARPLAPPGGEPDRESPRLVGTTPEQRAIVPGFTDKVEFHFDEKIGERGARDAVMVSPETGRPVLERDGHDLKVWLQGGWKPNQVYRVIITPGITDRFGNARREPAELVFSTGPPLTETAIAGLVIDRLTGRPLAEMRVQAISATDSTPHSTVTDTAGFFGLRYLPLGNYTVRAFEDANRNKVPDRSERRDTVVRPIRTATDTQVVELSLLTPDSTPARLVRADPQDSVEVRLFFDDYLDPNQPLNRLRVALFQMPDSARVGGNITLLTVRERERTRPRPAPPPPDTGAARPPAQPARPGQQPPRPAQPQPLPAPARTAVDTTRVLPFQELVLLSPVPLLPRTRYRVEISGVSNVSGIPNGGGSVSFTTRARPEAPRRDTIEVRPTSFAPRR
jgi:hypothetical protein